MCLAISLLPSLFLVSRVWQNRRNYELSRDVRKPDFCICENKDADQLRVTAKLISAFVFATRIVQSLRNFKPLAIFCSCEAWFVSDLVWNPEDRFSHNKAQFIFELATHDTRYGMSQMVLWVHAYLYYMLLFPLMIYFDQHVIPQTAIVPDYLEKTFWTCSAISFTNNAIFLLCLWRAGAKRSMLFTLLFMKYCSFAPLHLLRSCKSFCKHHQPRHYHHMLTK